MKHKNPQLIEIYTTLDKEQRSKFILYLKSPYFIKNKRLAVAALSLEQHLNKPVEKIKLQLFADAYPDEAYSDVKLRLLFSDLLKALKHFLYIDEKKSDVIEQSLFIIRHLRRTKKIQLFEQLAKQLKNEIEESKVWNPDQYDLKYRLDMEILSYESFRNRFNYFNFKESAEMLEVGSLIKRMRIYMEQLSQESIGRDSIEYPLMEQWLEKAGENKWEVYPELALYLQALQLFKHPDEEGYFHEYQKMLQLHEKDFDFERGRELYLIALNYSIRKINQNQRAYFQKTLELFQHCIDNGWILDYGIMSSLTYKNIIVLCIRMNDLSLAESLLEKYINLVDLRERNMIYQFCLAKIHKEKGDYQNALYLLNTSIFKDPLIELNARIEMIKIYYEILEHELMTNQIQSTRNLMRRSKKLGYHKEYYGNFLQHAHRLLSAFMLSKKEKEEWLKSITGDARLIEKTWLYNMVNAIGQLPSVAKS